MEHTNINKKKWKERLFQIFTILALLTIIYYLSTIALMVKNNYEAFDENPLLFGAKKYEIAQCTCQNSKGVEFLFNQEKLWREKTNEVNYTFEINLSRLGN